jgi:hypothetical protein
MTSNITAESAKNIPMENSMIMINSKCINFSKTEVFIIPMRLDNRRENRARYKQINMFVNNRDLSN